MSKILNKQYRTADVINTALINNILEHCRLIDAERSDFYDRKRNQYDDFNRLEKQIIGKQAEYIVAHCLREHGYTIVKEPDLEIYSHPTFEPDLVAQKNGQKYRISVKCSTKKRNGITTTVSGDKREITVPEHSYMFQLKNRDTDNGQDNGDYTHLITVDYNKAIDTYTVACILPYSIIADCIATGKYLCNCFSSRLNGIKAVIFESDVITLTKEV